MSDFAFTFKKLRTENNLTQQDLAEKLNITSQSISKWERGEATPDLSFIGPLTRIFNISADELLGLTDPEAKKKSFDKALCDLKLSDPERIQVAQQAIKEFPNIMRYHIELAESLLYVYDSDEEENSSKENAIQILKNVIERASSEKERAHAIDIIVSTLMETGKRDEAEEYIQKYPKEISPSKNQLISFYLTGEDKTVHHQKMAADSIEDAIVEMMHSEDLNLIESAILFMEQLFPQKDFGAFCLLYIHAHMLKAIELVKSEHYDEAIETIYKIHPYAIEKSNEYSNIKAPVSHPLKFLNKINYEYEPTEYTYRHLFKLWLLSPELGYTLKHSNAEFENFVNNEMEDF